MQDPGAPQDFASVYDKYFARVRNYVRAHIAGAAEADDAVSRVFERVLERLDSFDPKRGSFEAWLFAVARNAVRDHFRSRRWLSFFSLDETPEPEGREPGPDVELSIQEDRQRLSRALLALDERSRDILGLKFQAGLTNRQISEVLGLGESHVGVLVYRAVKKLQAELGDEAS